MVTEQFIVVTKRILGNPDKTDVVLDGLQTTNGVFYFSKFEFDNFLNCLC